MMEELPSFCNSLALGGARLREIKSIVSKLEDCEHGGRAFQKLPRHMQRRAVSTNPRRLPRCLREKHMREGGGHIKPSHRPSRKYRRRPCNLLCEYTRRQREHVWLETHIWHAKRFHMCRRWSYALPDRPTCRGHRASLRALTTGCLLQDVSYLCCIELEGDKSTLIHGLSRLLQPTSVDLLTSPQVLQGKQWVSLMLFEPDRQPLGALTEVDVMFHPPQAETVKLWVWTHPSAHTQVVESFVEIFQLLKKDSFTNNKTCETNDVEADVGNCGVKSDAIEDSLESGEVEKYIGKEFESDSGDNLESTIKISFDEEGIQNRKLKGDNEVDKVECTVETPVSKVENECVRMTINRNNANEAVTTKFKGKCNVKVPKDVNAEKLKLKNIPFEHTPTYSSLNNSVVMTLLKDTLNRFKLMGPRSYKVLSSAFLPATVKVEDDERKVAHEKQTVTWWEQYFADAERINSHDAQVGVWKQLAFCPHPPEKVILPLTVRDPRVTLPTKKLPSNDEESDITFEVELMSWPVDSALYISHLRDQVTLSKQPDTIINQQRSSLLIPGSPLQETPQESRLPLLLLSQPSCASGLGSGWEVVVAAGWGMSAFLPLVMSGGVVGGQHDAEKLHLEALTSLPPHLLPDTLAGEVYSSWLAEERRKKFFERPPASRHNYIKLGVQFPFSSPWMKIVQEWQPAVSSIYVLREDRLITCLAHMMQTCHNTQKNSEEKLNEDSSNSSNMNETFMYTYSTNSTNKGKHRKRKSETDATNGMKRAKCEDLKEENQPVEVENIMKDSTKSVILDGAEDLSSMNPGALVMVQLILAHKGTLESCAMVCLPKEEDFQDEFGSLRDILQGQPPKEPLHEDKNQECRARMREEHNKIKGRLRRVRRRAKQKVAEEFNIVSAASVTESVDAAACKALRAVAKENEAILVKYSSYKVEMENAWLMSATEPLQCGTRLIMGYTCHGTFSYTYGKAAGIGWVCLKPLLHLLQLYKNTTGQKSSLCPSNKMSSYSIPVLVRNPSSLQYRWAYLSVIRHPLLETCKR